MQKATVLILDDEHVVCDLLCQALESLPSIGTIHCCDRGRKAVEMIKQEKYHLLLLDIKMPGMTGIEVLKNVRKIDGDLEVIIITAQATVANAIEALREGVFDYIKKPFDIVKLRNTVMNAINACFLKEEKREYSEKLFKANQELEVRKNNLKTKVTETSAKLQIANSELERKVAELQLLHKIGGRINTLMFTDEILGHFCQSARETGLVRRIAIFLVEKGGQALVLNVFAGFDMEKVCTLPINEYGKKLLLEREQDIIFVPFEKLGSRKVVVLPVVQQAENLGLLVIETSYTIEPGMEESPLFQTLGNMLAGSLVRAYSIEEQLRLKQFNESILNNISSGLATLSSTGDVTYLNPKGSKILKIDSKAILGSPWQELFPVETDLLKNMEDSVEQEILLPLNDDSDGLPLRITSTPLVNSEGKNRGIIAIFDDLTNKKHIEEEMRKREQLAALGEISAGIAHEIRNPLAGLGTTVELMQMKFGNMEMARYFNIINDELARLEKMLKDFLKYGRPAHPDFNKVNITRLMIVTTELLEDNMQKQPGERIEINLPDGKFECMADSIKIHSIFYNLVLNAKQAVGENGRILINGRFCLLKDSRAYRSRLPVKRFRDNPSGLEVSIVDNGAGILEENFESLLKPFYTTKEEGTGLGLPIVQRMIDEHRGVFGIESAHMAGTSCHVFLPLNQPE